MLKVDISKRALKALKIIPTESRQKISEKVNLLSQDPRPRRSIQLQGKLSDYRRVRVGDYRVIYRVEGEWLKIVVIQSRNDGESHKELERILDP